MKSRPRPRPRLDDDDMAEPKPPWAFTVREQPKPLLLDDRGRRWERGIGYRTPYQRRSDTED
jgi:hypothetical protein